MGNEEVFLENESREGGTTTTGLGPGEVFKEAQERISVFE